MGRPFLWFLPFWVGIARARIDNVKVVSNSRTGKAQIEIELLNPREIEKIDTISYIIFLKVTVRGDFSRKNLFLQSDVVFDYESNGRKLRSLAPPGGEKKIIFIFFYKMTSQVGVGVFPRFF